MELFLHGSDLRRDVPIEDWESLVWAERYSSYGDFQITLKESSRLVGSLRNYKFISFSESNRLMMLETVDIPNQKSGKKKVTLKGRSVEAFLMNRTNTDNSEEGIFIMYNMSFGQMAAFIMNRYVINPNNTANKIPGLELGSVATGLLRDHQSKRDYIYNVVKTLCDLDDLGWMIRWESPASLVFDVYRGTDRTLPGLSYRRFGPDLENLQDPSYLESIANYKNHARVEGLRYILDVYPSNVPSPITGFNRRTLVVPARDIGTDAETPVSDDIPLLRERGRAALAEINNQYIAAADGDILAKDWASNSYGLGDIVDVKDTLGNVTRKRVTENIWSVDSRGARKTPAFSGVDPT